MSQKAVETKRQTLPSEPASELKSLAILIGRWNTDIKFKSDPDNQGNGWVTYEWMDGGFFIIEHFANNFKKEESHRGISIIGYDNQTQACVSRFFDNHGNFRTYKLSIKDGVFTITGDRERYTGKINDGGNTITGAWEQSTDGKSWQYLCDTTQTRIK